MPPAPKPVQPLNYQTPPASSGNWTLIWIISLVTASILLGAFLWMFSSASAPPVAIVSPRPPMVIPGPGIAPNVALPSDLPAATAASKTLDDLLAGKLDDDPDLGSIARKVNSFQSWSITSIIAKDEPPSSTFTGTLNSGSSRANFSIEMVKQKDGSWQVASFSGPNR